MTRMVSGESALILLKKLDAVHSRHAHVGNDDGVRPVGSGEFQALRAAQSRFHEKLAA